MKRRFIINQKTDVKTEEQEKEFILCIEDFGVGIKEEDISRVFEKSFTGYNGRNFYGSQGLDYI